MGSFLIGYMEVRYSLLYYVLPFTLSGILRNTISKYSVTEIQPQFCIVLSSKILVIANLLYH